MCDRSSKSGIWTVLREEVRICGDRFGTRMSPKYIKMSSVSPPLCFQSRDPNLTDLLFLFLSIQVNPNLIMAVHQRSILMLLLSRRKSTFYSWPSNTFMSSGGILISNWSLIYPLAFHCSITYEILHGFKLLAPASSVRFWRSSHSLIFLDMYVCLAGSLCFSRLLAYQRLLDSDTYAVSE